MDKFGTISTENMDIKDAIHHGLGCLNLEINLRPFQFDVIECYTLSHDVFCIAGTGSGKSMTYILAPFVKDYRRRHEEVTKDTLQSIVIIIQPLKALMKDQCQKLTSLGLKATYVGNDHDFEGMTLQKYNYIIASPETAITASFLDILEAMKEQICCIFIDESHCIQTL